MNRNIKFRAWDERNEEMRYSDIHNGEFYLNTKGVLYMYAIPKSESGLETKYYKNYDVMQFTGLKDKNGVEIYEGDILGFEVIRRFKEEYVQSFVVTWDKENAGWIQFSPKNKVMVLGNIHENPELLK